MGEDGFEVRVAGPSDCAAIAGLLAAFRDWTQRSTPAESEMRASVERIVDERSGEFLLANVADTPVGVCQLRYRWSVWTTAQDCWLEDLFVLEDHRKRGIGRALLSAAIERADSRGCKRVELDVEEANAAALALYQSLGFRDTPKGRHRSLLLGLRLPPRA